jgi:hypothetical protein
METAPGSGHPQPMPANAESSAPPCPACGGRLIPLRGALRCSRCYFALCEGCEGGDIGFAVANDGEA